MGTKNHPGKFDCYDNADPDEPMFVLLGRDPTAAMVVGFWCVLKEQMVSDGTSKSSPEKLEEARECARLMEEWARKVGKDPDAAFAAMQKVLGSFNVEGLKLTPK